jgi:GntR family transcriptional regulator
MNLSKRQPDNLERPRESAGERATGPIPLYVQVANALRRSIDFGKWSPGERLPSLEELAAEFRVARVTAREAIGILVRDGLVWRRQGSGTYISDKALDRRWLNLQTDWPTLLSLIDGTTMEILAQAENVSYPFPNPEEGEMAPGYQYLQRVDSKDGTPYCAIDIYMDQRIFDKAPEEFRTRAILPLLDEMEDLEIASASQVLTVGTADQDMAGLLSSTPGDPVANVRRVLKTGDGTIIYISDVVYRGDTVRLESKLI